MPLLLLLLLLFRSLVFQSSRLIQVILNGLTQGFMSTGFIIILKFSNLTNVTGPECLSLYLNRRSLLLYLRWLLRSECEASASSEYYKVLSPSRVVGGVLVGDVVVVHHDD